MKRAQTQSPQIPAGTPAAVRPTRIFHLLAGVSARRLRGLSLLASLFLVLAVSPLAAFSVLPWWSVLVAVAVLVADVFWLRQVALSLQAAGRAPGQAGESAGHARPAPRDTVYFDDGSEPMFESDADADGELHADAPAESESESESEVRKETLFSGDSDTLVMARPQHWPQSGPLSEADADPLAEYEPETVNEAVDETAAPPAPSSAGLVEPTVSFARADLSGWAPVPVPPPTYTLKAKAPEPVSEPTAFTEPTVFTESTAFTEPAETGPWSLEGLVYDCELDDLVERRSATGA